MKKLGLSIMICAALAAGVFTGCANTTSASAAATETGSTQSTAVVSDRAADASMGSMGSMGPMQETTTVQGSAQAPTFTVSDVFTDRDLEQTADLSSAKTVNVSDGQDVSITEEGVYVISGSASDCTITVNADSSAKVQLVLDGVSISNTNAPAIYVVSADKVFVTTASGTTNELSVTGTFEAIGEDNVDGVIFAKDDLVLNGQGTLVINSSANGIVGKDDVKVTGGTYTIQAGDHGIQGKDSVSIADGTFDITATTDAIHSNNSDDLSVGNIYIAGGSFNLKAGSDGVGGTATVQVDGGTFTIEAAEAFEGTFVQINDGTIGIQASDDGMNATTKSDQYAVSIEINGGNIDISMAAGDTDALDSNGNLIINGGTINITAQSPFDFDGQGQLNGGTVTVNGQQVTELTNQMMGGMGGGAMGGAGGMGGMDGGRGQRGDRGQQYPMGDSGAAPSGNSGGAPMGQQGTTSA